MEKNILEKLRTAVIDGEPDDAKNAAQEAVKSNIDPLIAFNQGLMAGMQEVSARYDRLEAFLTDLITSGEAMTSALTVLKPAMAASSGNTLRKGKIVIGTVQKDHHSIGKNIVAIMLTAQGYDVIDLGVDVPPMKFIEKAEEINADIIALSALLSPTRPFQRDVIQLLTEMNIREKFKVIIGGGVVNQEWADSIGADAYADNANQAVKTIMNLLDDK